ncbi:hypothetical protein XCM_10725 [Xanthomonas citri pv. mangiferaeindicae]|nr:hypothetical protein XCM_10725 [Xanthomonas citri pv. mangiferaeindicae]
MPTATSASAPITVVTGDSLSHSAFHAFFSAGDAASSWRTFTANAGSACASSMSAIRCVSVILPPLRHTETEFRDTPSDSATLLSESREHAFRAVSSNLFMVSTSYTV